MTDSNRLRKEVLGLRDQLTPRQRQEKSRIIHQSLLALDEIKNGSNIFIYVHFRSEVETAPIITDLLSRGKKVSVPLTDVSAKRLDIIAVTDPETDLIPGYCGIPEPRSALVAARTCDPGELDVVILPGSVFDERGGRYGYGGGYYDRLLGTIPNAHRIAAAFEMQLVDRLTLHAHDQILDCIVTEQRVIRIPGRLR